ncbi:unnamed protein product, partial [Brenthis ino]
MHTLLVLIAAALACAVARPPVPTDTPQVAPLGPQRQRVPMPPQSEFLSAYALPRYLMPHDIGYDDSPRIPRPPNNLLDQVCQSLEGVCVRETWDMGCDREFKYIKKIF